MITVNGEREPWTPGLTVRGVLALKNYKFPLLIIHVDGVLVAPRDYDATPVPDGADVKVIHLLSGG